MAFAMNAVCLFAVLASASAIGHIPGWKNIDKSTMRKRNHTQDCDCMNWHDMPRIPRVRPFCETGGNGGHDNQVCEFIQNINKSFCINWDWSSKPDEPQYCYVSTRCQDLNGGERVDKTFAKKFCTWKDELLSDKTPDELLALSRKENMDLSILMKMAYPTRKAFVGNWERAKAHLTGAPILSTRGPLSHNETQELKLCRSVLKPVLIDSEDGTPPYGLLFNNSVYEITKQRIAGAGLIGASLLDRFKGKNKKAEASKMTKLTNVIEEKVNAPDTDSKEQLEKAMEIEEALHGR